MLHVSVYFKEAEKILAHKRDNWDFFECVVNCQNLFNYEDHEIVYFCTQSKHWSTPTK